MSRSKWKSPYMDPNMFIESKTVEKITHDTLVVSRNSKIIPKFVGLTINVHNGKKHTNLTVTENMLGHKFGEFSFTRANFIFKKKNKKK